MMELYYEIVGYVGSFLVALSLAMKNIRMLRKINLIGAFTFATYGILIGAIPVFILNGFIVLIDIYYLYKMYITKEQFKMVPVLDKNHNYLKLFLDYYIDDIVKFFPQFDREKIDTFECFFLLRDLRPAGLLIFEEISKSQIRIDLDYAIPDYRDMKFGKYLYNIEIKHLKKRGYKEIVAKSDIPKHIKYLLNLGFNKSTKNNSIYIKII